MFYVPDKFNAKEKTACLNALIYVLNLNKRNIAAKRKHLAIQMKMMDIAEDKYDSSKPPCTFEALVKSLKGLENLRVQRYIISQMVMLSVADHDIGEEEIRNIYALAETIGVSSEKVGDFFIWAAKGIEWKLEGVQLVEEDL